MTHTGYILAAYLISFGVLSALTIYIVLDLKTEKARLDRLDEENITRRDRDHSEGDA